MWVCVCGCVGGCAWVCRVHVHCIPRHINIARALCALCLLPLRPFFSAVPSSNMPTLYLLLLRPSIPSPLVPSPLRPFISSPLHPSTHSSLCASSAFFRLLHPLHPHLLVAAGGAPEQGGGGQLLIGLGEAMRTLRTFPVPVSVPVSVSVSVYFSID